MMKFILRAMGLQRSKQRNQGMFSSIFTMFWCTHCRQMENASFTYEEHNKKCYTKSLYLGDDRTCIMSFIHGH